MIDWQRQENYLYTKTRRLEINLHRLLVCGSKRVFRHFGHGYRNDRWLLCDLARD